MRVEISVPEVVSLFKEIQNQPEKVFEMIRLDVRDIVGKYLTPRFSLSSHTDIQKA